MKTVETNGKLKANENFACHYVKHFDVLNVAKKNCLN